MIPPHLKRVTTLPREILMFKSLTDRRRTECKTRARTERHELSIPKRSGTNSSYTDASCQLSHESSSV